MLEKAILIATNAHQGQIDKAGKPYILHPLRLMFSRVDETERISAVLHDVIEDTDITLDYLRNEGFSEEILSSLDALTRRRNESYNEFISRIVINKIACYVKLADLCDNMDLSRIKNPTEKDYQRVEKYQKASNRIIHSLEEEGDREFIKWNCKENLAVNFLVEDKNEEYTDFQKATGLILSDESLSNSSIPTRLGASNTWVVKTKSQTEIGDIDYIASEFVKGGVIYRFHNYNEDGKERHHDHEHSIAAVLHAIIYNPKGFSIEEFQNDYSKQERDYLNAVRDKLLFIQE